MNRLKGKRALITGGTSGIGLETAKQFLKEGARVAITGRNPDTLESARNELQQDVLIIPSDSSSVAAQKQVVDAIQQVFGGLDVLFVNAGIAELKPVEQWDEAALRDKVDEGASEKIELNEPTAVAWVYMTGWATDDGPAHFRRDIYNLDKGAKPPPRGKAYAGR